MPCVSAVTQIRAGAEKLLGQGDMLFKSPDATRLQRLQGVFVSPAEIRRIADAHQKGVARAKPRLKQTSGGLQNQRAQVAVLPRVRFRSSHNDQCRFVVDILGRPQHVLRQIKALWRGIGAPSVVDGFHARRGIRITFGCKVGRRPAMAHHDLR